VARFEITLPEAAAFRRGDANSDGERDIADAIFILGYLFGGGVTPSCFDSADANDDEAVDIADAIAVLSYLFASGGDLPEPFDECGIDQTSDPIEDPLSCETFPACAR
jgi:hypothetical protein